MAQFKEVAPKRFKRIEKIDAVEEIPDNEHIFTKNKMQDITLQFSYYIVMYVILAVVSLFLVKFGIWLI